MCIDFRDLNKACPKDYYPLPRIDQLVDSTSGCEILSMIDASQGYHQIMLAPEGHKRVSFITSGGMFCYVAISFGLKNAGATYQRLVEKIFRPQLGRSVCGRYARKNQRGPPSCGRLRRNLRSTKEVPVKA
ncbi:UNVERIFIED_CONTAM: putative protein K02A2.6 [Sesamum latifolium]|uniref:Reverse transcriptase domain-containing protein n=1 Tax=Sesamum latifolium TaxID=2727402 RepID=A0AAW2XR75_9LAMI